MKITIAAVILLVIMIPVPLPGNGPLGSPGICQAQTLQNFPEGNDYATRILGLPWNMNDYHEISQYINHSGQVSYLQNMELKNGLFAARSTSAADAQFYTLFPGYWTAMLIGKVGHNYPIQSSQYRVLYLAMKVDTRQALPPDMFQIFWFADERQNAPGGVWGSVAKALYPESLGILPNPVWKLYKVDLGNPGPGAYGAGTPWNGNPTWQGLRVDPTAQADTLFQVDWVRLTDGQPVHLPLSFACGSGPCSVYIRPAGTTREILIETGVTSPYNLDLQGIPPGEYTYLVKSNSGIVGSGDFVVNDAPIVHFLKPAPSSSEDYSLISGDAWDMTQPSDGLVDCASSSFENGLLHINTPTGAAQPTGCWGGVFLGSPISDPRIVLNTPVPFKAADYRYLSFRMYTEGPWQDLVRGMMARWIWMVQHAAGTCIFVSQDIPLNVGWHTYTIDLFDPFNGFPEAVAGPCALTHWKDSGLVTEVRFDPNENILGYPLKQSIDWIKLHKENRSPQGESFPIKIYLNKTPDLVNLTYFYTTDPKNFTDQKPALTLHSAPPLRADGKYTIFLPMINRSFDASDIPPPNSVTFAWDTSQVSPGTYYICVRAEDGLNTQVYCSDTPALVY